MRITYNIYILIIFFLTGTIHNFAQDLNSHDYVNDFANVLTPSERDSLNIKLKHFEHNSGIELVIVTVKSLHGMNIEEYSLELANRWQIGKKDSNNGILLLNVIDDKIYRLEVGNGLTDKFFPKYQTDALNEGIPYLKNANYFKAYDKTIIKINHFLYKKIEVNYSEEIPMPDILKILLIILIAVFITLYVKYFILK